MIQKIESDFYKASKDVEKSLRIGDFSTYVKTHKNMADILHSEGKFRDEIRSRIIAFYFDISGISGTVQIDELNIKAISLALEISHLPEKDFCDIYYDVIKTNTAPCHLMTIKGSYKLLVLCLQNKWGKAFRIREILEKARVSKS